MARSRIGSLAVFALLLAALSLLLAPLAIGSQASPAATRNGAQIPLSEVSRHHCHDGAYPEIRCFDDEVSRDTDAVTVVEQGKAVGTVEKFLAPVARASSSYYVVWYEHSNYGGASYMTAFSHSDLTAIGWNDVISSFKSINGQRPKWYDGAGYSGDTWQWAAGAWVSYVGNNANDRFSSVRNLP